MRIYLHEITDQETELDFTEADAWVRDTVAASDESADPNPSSSQSLRPATAPAAATKPQRPIALHVSMSQVDDVVVLNGDLNTTLNLVCSRCAAAFVQPLTPRFSALFCKDPVMAGVGYLAGRDHDKPEGQVHGISRHRADGTGRVRATGEADSVSAADGDLDITYLAHDYLELADVLQEQIQLQVPFQPLCKEDCQGICTTCGTDLNTGRCACSRIRKDNPFSVLKDLKLS